MLYEPPPQISKWGWIWAKWLYGFWNVLVNRYPLASTETPGQVINFEYPVGVPRRYGAVGDGVANDTVSIQRAFDSVGPYGLVKFTFGDNHVITDQGGGVALDVSGADIGIHIDMNGAILQYGTGTGTALRIGNDQRLWEPVFTSIRIHKTVPANYDNLTGKGIEFINMGQATFRDCYIIAFSEGYSFRPSTTGEGVTINQFWNLNTQACHYGIYIEPADFETCFVTANKFFGGFLNVDITKFTNIVSTDPHLISIRNPYKAKSANTVDGNQWFGMTIEHNVTKKIFCEGNGNQWFGCYFDAGSYSAGSASHPYRVSGVSGFTSTAGSNVIVDSGHGLDSKLLEGDVLAITSTDNLSDSHNYVVTSISANNITLNKSFASSGTGFSFEYFTSNIYFAPEANNNSIIGCDSIAHQVISSSGDTTFDNIIVDGRMGVMKGALPALGPRNSAANPGGLIDTPQSGLMNMIGIQSTTINAYLGNMNNHATDANTQLLFVADDTSQRESVFCGLRADKQGRSSSQAYGDLVWMTRASGSNTNLVDGVTLTSAGRVTVHREHFLRTATPGITAHTGSSQGDGPLTTDINQISVCGTTGDAVTLPSAVGGMSITIINDGANACDVFPASSDNLGAGANTAASLAAGNNITYDAYDAVNWEART